jgi:hypothetical protein
VFTLDEGNFSEVESLGDGHTFSQIFTAAGSYKLGVMHTPTREQIKDSPISFDVRPGPPSEFYSRHNLEDFGVVDSSDFTSIEMRVLPLDGYNNTISAAAGFAVKINEGEPIPLLAPTYGVRARQPFCPCTSSNSLLCRYSYEHEFEPEWEGTLTLSFTLDGKDIKNSPVIVEVAPDRASFYQGVLFGTGLAILVLGNLVYKRFTRRGVASRLEKVATVNEKLRALLHDKIHLQNLMMFIEFLDVGSGTASRQACPSPILTLVSADFFNGFLKLLVLTANETDGGATVAGDAGASEGGDDAAPTWLLAGFVILGAYSVPLGLYQIVSRGRVKTSYREIINGDDPEVAKALDAADGVLTPKSLAIRHALISLDIAVADLGLRGFLAEDVPSIVLNCTLVMMQMAKGVEADLSLYVRREAAK